MCVWDQRSNRQRSSENRSQHFNDMGLLQKLRQLPWLPRPLVHSNADTEGKQIDPPSCDFELSRTWTDIWIQQLVEC